MPEHNMNTLAVGLQNITDDQLLGKINSIGSAMENYSQKLHELRNFIVDLQAYRADDDYMDLSPLEGKIEAFKEKWEELKNMYPDLDECPISNDLDLKKVSTKDLDAIERKVDNLVTRMQNKYPKMMLDIEMHTNLHKLITDIITQIHKSNNESTRRIIGNHLTR